MGARQENIGNKATHLITAPALFKRELDARAPEVRLGFGEKRVHHCVSEKCVVNRGGNGPALEERGIECVVCAGDGRGDAYGAGVQPGEIGLHCVSFQGLLQLEMSDARVAVPFATAHWAGGLALGLLAILGPLVDTCFVEVLAALCTEGDFLEHWIQIVETNRASTCYIFAVFLEPRLEVRGCAADEVFMYGEVAGEIGDLEADDFAAETMVCE